MNIRNLRLYPLLVASLIAMAPASAFAQDSGEDSATTQSDEDSASSGGTYEWKPSWGAGVEAGIFFNSLSRWNANLLDGQREFDVDTVYHFDGAIEASFIEGTRLTLFGGYTTPFVDNPSFGAWYVGLEPAFAFRRNMWEMALGVGVGMGKAGADVDPNLSGDATLVLVRPFIEVRRYLGSHAAVYLRGGFNQWLPYDVETSGLTFGSNVQANTNEDELDEGGPYLALGLRFGSYPEHTKPDSDGDGVADDDDKCPAEPGVVENDGCPADSDGDGVADKDDKCPEIAGVAENDGCPLDTDGDGVYDEDDKCPEVAGPAENDGCPNDADGDGVADADDKCPEIAGLAENDGCPLDTDGDGIIDKEDKCPKVAGVAENDGCPAKPDDTDGDGIVDKDDECPNQPGVAERNGCPLKRVVVTMKRIMINEKIFFELAKADIKTESNDLLNEIAKVLNENPRIKKIEIQGHTDHAGKETFNQKLSEQRAQSVFDYLAGKGVDEERMVAKGYGETKPLVPLAEGEEESSQDAAKNRRVEFVILEQDPVKKTVREDQVPDGAEKVEDADDAKEDADTKAESDDTESDDTESDDNATESDDAAE